MMVVFVLLSEIIYECKMAQSKWVIISYPNCIILCALEKEDSQCGKKDMQMSNEFK